MEAIRLRLLCVIFYSELHCIRLVLGVSELFTGLVLLSLAGDSDLQMYKVMGTVAGMSVWSAVFLCMGFAQIGILALKLNKSYLIVPMALLDAMLWLYTVIAVGLVSVNAVSGNIGMLLGAAWVFVRTGLPPIDRRIYDRRKRNDT